MGLSIAEYFAEISKRFYLMYGFVMALYVVTKVVVGASYRAENSGRQSQQSILTSFNFGRAFGCLAGATP